jgi:hypothetical protein
MKYFLAAFAVLALAASAHAAEQRFPAPNGNYAPGVVVLCISNGVAIPTTSGACDGGGVPVVITGGLVQTTSCPANPISKKIPPLC